MRNQLKPPQRLWNENLETSMQALKYILGNVLSRLSSDGHFYFAVEMTGSGRLSDYPTLKKLVDEVEQNTIYKLVLVPRMTNDGSKTIYLSGALLPK